MAGVPIYFLQRMSDVRIPEARCGYRWADGRCWLGADWQAVGAMGIAAVDDFNARDGSVVPAFGALAGCDKRLNVSVLDTGSSETPTLSALIDILDESMFVRLVQDRTTPRPAPARPTPIASGRLPAQPPCSTSRLDILTAGGRACPVRSYPAAIIGPARSASVAVTAPITGVLGITQISYWASSKLLNDASRFPTFARTFPTDAAAATAVCVVWCVVCRSAAAAPPGCHCPQVVPPSPRPLPPPPHRRMHALSLLAVPKVPPPPPAATASPSTHACALSLGFPLLDAGTRWATIAQRPSTRRKSTG